ncbi:DUF1150 domain-containing protein [Roseomonas sp. NAR14]|uniref:DUF1150 domain-containing protein n=1 Tax=Roseomonas acroporae TaxID=2937791 RepID=A0A9X2BT99_9PROT|nr:DUF1150 family protein [Roseomonas acroporae]MCK8783056.1 DUF1150 domain-containing protein [Roseomonas acroporae]
MNSDTHGVTGQTETPEGAQRLALKSLSPQDFARLGVQQIAYIRPVVVDGNRAIAIHAADGTPIGAAPNAELAVAAIIQHELAPVLVH